MAQQGPNTQFGCKTVNNRVDMSRACRYTYNNPRAFAAAPFWGNAYSWSCSVLSLNVAADLVGSSATVIPLGGVDVQKYCSVTYPGSRAVVVDPNSNGGWRCQ